MDNDKAFQLCLKTANELESAVNALRLRLVDPRGDLNLPAYVSDEADGHLEGALARDKAAYTLARLTYQDGQAPSTVLVLRGAIMCSTQTIALVGRVNAAKDAFMSARAVAITKVVEWPIGEEVNLFEAFLLKTGRARLHINQVKRHLITAIASEIDAVGWSQTRAPGMRRTTAGDLLARIVSKPQNTLQQHDAEKLSQMPPATPIAVKRKGAVVNVVNIQSRSKGPSTLKTSLPLFILGEEMVHYLPARESAMGARRRRSDAILEHEPFLASIPGYRYCADPALRNQINLDRYPLLRQLSWDVNGRVVAKMDERTAWLLYQAHLSLIPNPILSSDEARLVMKLTKRNRTEDVA